MRLHLAACAVVLLTACSKADGSFELMDRELEITRELRIGSIDAAESALTYARGLAVGPDGRIYSLHPQESRIRIHEADGRPAGFIGREGDGPGEFRNLGTIGWVGDTLWVLDYSAYRFSYFDGDGTLLRSRAIPIDLGERGERSPPRPNGLLPDGSIYGSSPAWSREVAAGTITEEVVLRLDERSQPLDTLYTYSLVNSTWAIEDPRSGNGFGSYGAQPFSDTEIVRHTSTGAEVIRVDRGVPVAPEGASFRVSRITFDGDTLFSREYPYTPHKIDPAHVDSLVERRSESMARLADRMPGAPTPARAAELARASLYVPTHHPPVSELLPGRDGSLWLRREDLRGASVDWLILSADGRVLGTVALPRALRLMAAEEGRVWGMETDEVDVPYLMRYAVGGDEREE